MINIQEVYEKGKGAEIKVFPSHVNRASGIGHGCTRYLVLQRLHWDKQEKHDVTLQCIFEEGNMHERQIISDLGAYLPTYARGWDIIDQQRSFALNDKGENITGHMDFIISDGKERIAVEVKSMSDHIWNSIHSYSDIRDSKKFWIKKYPAQIQLYMLAANLSNGMFILKNKTTGQIKQIDVELDYAYAEGILQKGIEIEKHLKDGTIPEPTLDHDTCKACNLKYTCNPDMDYGDPMEFMEDAEIECLLNEWDLLLEPGKAFKKLDKEVKEIFRGKKNVMIGNFMVSDEGKSRSKVVISKIDKEVKSEED